jgi:hypothetical protein
METPVLPLRPADTGGGWANGALMVLGQLLLSASVLLFFISGSGYLARISPVSPEFGPLLPLSIGPWYFLHVGLILSAMVACTGRPFPRAEFRALPGAFSQVLGGFNVICTAWAAQKIIDGFYFFDPDTRCAYDSCWPMGEQEVALIMPMIIVGMVMIAVALLVRRLAWRWRALLPPVVAVVLLLVQHLLWYSWLLPIFRQPPA